MREPLGREGEIVHETLVVVGTMAVLKSAMVGWTSRELVLDAPW